MEKKKGKQKKEKEAYVCSCGSNSFLQEGAANFKEEVTISTGKKGLIIEGGCPELDIINAKIKCSKCGIEV
ncbi:MAG: hypothetical protein FD145_1400 [Candidatus Saganbacteria bacterium]|uniref:Uncharacterized protein n=1 Tax=Candidatus Saganbacteria bacterium TaxID=2575572 RepID=A0A833NRF9_UNCSA|nr:MAG: hypothetical protein FD145_1400 [Candidatus Saganbacteria bacterium]